jgi:hypothetical protein
VALAAKNVNLKVLLGQMLGEVRQMLARRRQVGRVVLIDK